MKVINVETKEKLDELVNKSIFTLVGIKIEDGTLEEIEEFIRENGFKEEEMTFYIFNGELVNKSYELEGFNRFKNDLTFVSIENFYNPMLRIQIGAKWLDDLIYNSIN